ncbi:MAG: pyruvate formate lyase family protein [Candidatus Hodarchaeota archaeon]
MKSLTPRIENLRDFALDWKETHKPYIGQRIYHYLMGLTETMPFWTWDKKISHCLASVVANFKPHIHVTEKTCELLVGYNFYGDDSKMGYELRLSPPPKKSFHEYMSMGALTPDQIDFCLEVFDEDLEEILPRGEYAPEQSMEALKARAAGLYQAGATPENHTIIGYEKVLRLGFKGILAELEVREKALNWRDPHSFLQRHLIECVREIAEAACTMGERYADEAEKLMESVGSATRKQELKEIASTCRRIPAEPARSFREAVQSLWFAHVINTWEDGINANSIGRVDQILYPYYKEDIDSGRITEDEAFEILCALWLKLYRDYDVQQAQLGGLKPDGSDGTNELSYLMLDVTEALGFIRCMSVRLHSGTPPAFLRRALEVVKLGMGVPFFFNDEVLIPALVESGVSLEDARDYGAIGCVEITIPGKCNPHAVSNRINLLKCLELALNDGSPMPMGSNKPEVIGPRTGPPESFKNFDDLLDAYEAQVEYFTDMACSESNRLEYHHGLHLPMPYKSLLTEGCLDSGRDFNKGGARYNWHETMIFGIPNVADALEAIRTLVFEDKKFTLEQLAEQLRSNWEADGDAVAGDMMRNTCLNRPVKYGNDRDSVDELAARVMEHACKHLKKQKGIFKGGFLPQPFTFLWLVEEGRKTAASADGRRARENLAYSLSPHQGRDINGLTAMINSLGKLPHELAAGGPSAIIEVDPALFSEENMDNMVVVMQSAIEKRIGQMQFNVVDEATLVNAQEHPEKYPNLMVRVSGFSQRFVLLDKDIQDHIIARTKHARS